MLIFLFYVLIIIIAISPNKRLSKVPTKYLSAKGLFSSCLKRAKDLAVKTNAIEVYKVIIPKMTIIIRSSFPMNDPILSSSIQISTFLSSFVSYRFRICLIETEAGDKINKIPNTSFAF